MRTLLAGLVLLLVACDLTLTDTPVPYADLDATERAAADRIFARLQAYDARLQAVSGGAHALGPIALDKDRLDVSLHDLWVLSNLGDDRIHLSVWENLTGDQRTYFGSWFAESAAAAATRYGKLFYEFIALHLAGVQTVYAIQGVDWVYNHRNAFNVDRDAQRLVVTYLRETDAALYNLAWSSCGALRGLFDARFGPWYEQHAYLDHFREITDPHNPVGQIYMICRHMEDAEIRRVMWSSSFAAEVEVLEEYRTAD
jgi:hypothetical protein